MSRITRDRTGAIGLVRDHFWSAQLKAHVRVRRGEDSSTRTGEAGAFVFTGTSFTPPVGEGTSRLLPAPFGDRLELPPSGLPVEWGLPASTCRSLTLASAILDFFEETSSKGAMTARAGGGRTRAGWVEEDSKLRVRLAP